MLLRMISINLYVIIHYIAEENIFVFIVYIDFITQEILKRHIKDRFKIHGKQIMKMPKKGEYVKFKSFERKIKLPFMISADFESILVLEDNGNQNPNE